MERGCVLKSAKLVFDIFDLLLVKLGTSKKLVGPWSQKLAILQNRSLAKYAHLRCASSIVETDPMPLDLFAYVVLWEPNEPTLQEVIQSINRGGKLVVYTKNPTKHFRLAQQNSRAMFAPVEKIQITKDDNVLCYITVYSLRANKTKEISFTTEQIHRSISRAKFDNVSKREYIQSGNFVPVPTWNNQARLLFLLSNPSFIDEK